MDIFFAHNSHNRPKTLINTVNAEKNVFPNAKFFLSVTQNGTITESVIGQQENVTTIPTNGNGWQLGCINCFYSSISKICETYDDGIIIFSHDDVYLKDSDVVKANIALMIEQDLSYIVRRPDKYYGENYFMMEVVYLNIKHVKKMFTPYDDFFIKNPLMIPKDVHNYHSAEVWLFDKLNEIKNGLIIDYSHYNNTLVNINNNLTEKLGYEHINLGQNGWKE